MNGVTSDLALDATRVPPKIELGAKRSPVLLALGTLAVIAAGAILFWFNPAQYRLYPFCFFHELTGLNCPGCGGTRALHHLLHGKVMAAFHANALLIAALPLFAWLGVRFAVGRIKRPPSTRRIAPAWFWIILALAVAFTVFRNLPAFAWLSP